VAREAAAAQIAGRLRTQTALDDLQTDTLGRIVTLAKGGNTSAEEALQAVREFLAAPNEQANLASHIVTWKKQANEIIDAALKAQTPEPPQEEVTPTVTIHKDGRALWRITSAQAEIGGETVPLDPQDIEAAMGQLLRQVKGRSGEGQAEVIIRIMLSTSQQEDV
jgi:hypothetical protein